MEKKELTVKELNKLSGNLVLRLDDAVLSLEKTKLHFSWPDRKLTGYTNWREYRPYECYTDAKGHRLTFDVSEAKSIVSTEELSPSTTVRFEFQYVPKPIGGQKKKRQLT